MTADPTSTGYGPSPARAVPRPEFAVVRRGYDMDSVHDYVSQVAAELSRLASDNWDLRRELEATRSALAAAQAASADQVLIDLKAELTAAMARLDDADRPTD